MSAATPLTLTFNYTARDTQNEYCPGRECHFTPHGETARFYPPGFARKSESTRIIDLSESLALAAKSLRTYARNRQTITPATFTPH